MKPRYAWWDIPWIVAAIALLIPLFVELARIVGAFIRDVGNHGL